MGASFPVKTKTTDGSSLAEISVGTPLKENLFLGVCYNLSHSKCTKNSAVFAERCTIFSAIVLSL